MFGLRLPTLLSDLQPPCDILHRVAEPFRGVATRRRFGLPSSLQCLCLKADLLPLRFRWRHQLSNRIEYYLELTIVFLFEFFQFPCQFGVGSKHLAQSDEGAHDLDVDGDSAFAAQHA